MAALRLRRFCSRYPAAVTWASAPQVHEAPDLGAFAAKLSGGARKFMYVTLGPRFLGF
jgi:hypothetical protein